MTEHRWPSGWSSEAAGIFSGLRDVDSRASPRLKVMLPSSRRVGTGRHSYRLKAIPAAPAMGMTNGSGSFFTLSSRMKVVSEISAADRSKLNVDVKAL